MSRFLLEVTDLHLRLGGRDVLRGVDLRAAPGSVTALLGPSGSGKSTFLRCLNRLLEPPPGTVVLGGRDVTGLEPLALRRRVGMVFQRPAVLPGTVGRNVAYGPGLSGRVPEAAEVAELLRLAGLDPALAGRPAAELSGGEAQRMALARCLANDPEVLLLDEPTSALDPAARAAVGEAVAGIVADRGVTVVWITHDVEQARTVADSLHLLSAGRIVASGPPADLLADPEGPVARFARGEGEGGAHG